MQRSVLLWKHLALRSINPDPSNYYLKLPTEVAIDTFHEPK